MLKHSILFDEETIAARVGELAEEIWADVPGTSLVMIGLLTGGFVFLADLIRAAARLGLEPRVDFIAASHYGSGTEPRGEVAIHKDARLHIQDRPVLIVDDILDSGWTLKRVREHIAGRGALWLRTCVLLDKPDRRRVQIEADYVGFKVPDLWVIGYGLDVDEEGRALPYVAAMDPAGGVEVG